MLQRCAWCTNDPLYLDYHDHEWGVPLYDDRRLFELLILEGTQAGLSWLTVLRKRENYRLALERFEPARVAKFSDAQVQALLDNPGLIRNKRKIEALRPNARVFLSVQEAFGRFADYLWGFVDGEPIINHWRYQLEVPISTAHSDTLSKDMKARGFQFVGSIICYAYMQAAGLIMDHTTDCFRHPQLTQADDHRITTDLAQRKAGQSE
ncbi:MAG: DNA-3-methyladenine glycosylase I [Nitrococcus mobilis]|nr:DNA-3-methyladenine glycosylase I [Nitrococcus mobilis]